MRRSFSFFSEAIIFHRKNFSPSSYKLLTSYVFYVMNHQTQLSGAECIRASWKLSKGMFWKIVLFNLSFIGWWILVLVTLGGMYLYVSPYYDTARANLYLDAAGDAYGAGNEVSRPAEAA